MSEYQILAVIAGFACAYSLVAARLEKTPVNGALIYVAFGILCGPSVLNWIDLHIQAEGLKWLAELTLAIVLFTDSATANIRVLRKFERLPIRLLLVGLPLTIALGFAAGLLFQGQLSWLEIALLATMLAPTDAALGQAVLSNESVPGSVREGLNVESGLNDGICVPVLLIFLALATWSDGDDSLAQLVVKLPVIAIGVGVLVGLVVGFVSSLLIARCSQRGWTAGAWKQLPVIGFALLSFATAQYFNGSGFIAAFVGGMTFGILTPKHKGELLEAAEGAGDTMSLVTWLLFGTFITSDRLFGNGYLVIVYAILSLTIVRMLPVFLCVFGLRLKTDTKLFMGWFGPRGLASIVFLVLVMGDDLPGSSLIESTVIWTILLSVIAHGLTANPLSKRYGERVMARGKIA